LLHKRAPFQCSSLEASYEQQRALRAFATRDSFSRLAGSGTLPSMMIAASFVESWDLDGIKSASFGEAAKKRGTI
jgi:hypothetical protein